jgi:Tfp pilus assembly protein PilF
MFEMALDHDPRDVNSLNSLALILQHQGKHVEAQGHMGKALRLAPYEPSLHCNYGSFLHSVRKGLSFDCSTSRKDRACGI